MIYIIGCLLVFLLVTNKSDIIPEQTSLIYTYVTVAKSIFNDCTFDVKIDDSEIILIFMYHSKSTKKNSVDKLHAFYTALSCKFADWTISNIYEFVLQSSLLHPYRHPSNNYVITDSLTQFDFESLLTTFTTSLEEDVQRMVRI